MYPQLFTKTLWSFTQTLFETLNMMSALHSLDNVQLCWYVISTQAYLMNPIHTSNMSYFIIYYILFRMICPPDLSLAYSGSKL